MWIDRILFLSLPVDFHSLARMNEAAGNTYVHVLCERTFPISLGQTYPEGDVVTLCNCLFPAGSAPSTLPPHGLRVRVCTPLSRWVCSAVSAFPC